MENSTEFKYMEIARYLRERMEKGDYRVGEVIPSLRHISELLSVNRASVKRAITVLEQEGYIECIPSVGTIVRRSQMDKALVGYLVSNLQDPFHLEMIREIDSLLHRVNSGVIVAEGLSTKRLIGMGATKIIKAGQLARTETEDVVRTVYIGGFDLNQDCVSVDNESGMKLIYEHLHELGHRRIAYVATAIESPEGFPDIRHSFLLKCASKSVCRYIRNHSFFINSYSEEECAMVIDRILQSAPLPTALVCSSDWLAINILSQARLKGIKVPRELSITGFDNIFIGNLIGVPLTTISYPIRQAAEEAVKILFDSNSAKPTSVVCTPSRVIRKSTRKVQNR